MLALPALLLLAAPAAVRAQVEERPTLSGKAFVGDTALVGGTVVLHHVSDDGQGEVDSLAVGADGTFSFELPNVPDPTRNDVFFASVRHAGVLYFGPAITLAVQLDTLYEVHAYDTVLAPPEGASVALQSRSLFLEPDGAGAWRATDLFQVRNDADRTIVARDGGRTWRYPLPGEARDVSAGEGDLSFSAAEFDSGDLVVSAALPPGERLFVVRYWLDSPFVSFPTPGLTEALDVLVREPAPALDVEGEGIETVGRMELEPGSTYRRFTGMDFAQPFVRVVQSEETGPPPVRWAAVILALVLAAGGLAALRGGARAPAEASVPASGGRQALLTQVARLDEDFAARATPSVSERRRYEDERTELVRRLRSGN